MCVRCVRLRPDLGASHGNVFMDGWIHGCISLVLRLRRMHTGKKLRNFLMDGANCLRLMAQPDCDIRRIHRDSPDLFFPAGARAACCLLVHAVTSVM